MPSLHSQTGQETQARPSSRSSWNDIPVSEPFPVRTEAVHRSGLVSTLRSLLERPMGRPSWYLTLNTADVLLPRWEDTRAGHPHALTSSSSFIDVGARNCSTILYVSDLCLD